MSESDHQQNRVTTSPSLWNWTFDSGLDVDCDKMSHGLDTIIQEFLLNLLFFLDTEHDLIKIRNYFLLCTNLDCCSD